MKRKRIDFTSVHRMWFYYIGAKIIFEALVVPEIKKVLLKYAPLLGYAGLTENTESEEN